MNMVSDDHPNKYANGKMVHPDDHDLIKKSSSAVRQLQRSGHIHKNSSPEDDDHQQAGAKKKKKQVVIKYMECLKNHAAAIGGHATDGCGEFMPGGEEGTTMEALKCSACNCHRNFHRKVTQGECYFHFHDDRQQSHPNIADENDLTNFSRQDQQKISTRSSGQEAFGFRLQARAKTAAISKARTMQKVAMASTMIAEEVLLEKQEGVVQAETRPREAEKKRYRTKFSQEQKEQMWRFAEKVGWKIQNQDDCTVTHFCREIGIKRSVLKVWMHNNKHNLAKKSFLPTN